MSSTGTARPTAVASPPRMLVRRLLAALATVAAVGLHVFLQWGPLLRRPDFAWSSFRNYFPGDQLSYMSMVVNSSQGRFDNVEPFTSTGTNTYPHLYYYVLGAFSKITGISPLQAWSIGGLIVQVVLIVALALTLYLVTSRWWAPILAPLPFVIGAFASFFADGTWFISMNSHAVLWGPFAVFYTLNGETASLALGSVGMLLLLVAYVRLKERVVARRVVFGIGAACIGLAANVQTYGFLTSVYLAVFVVAAFVVVKARNRWLVIASVGGLLIVVFVGPLVAGRFGPLASLAFGMLPAVPGMLALLWRQRLDAVIPLAALVLAASPQVLATVLGLVSGDPFLTYRVASSKDLGVDARGLLSALPVLIPLVAILIAGVFRKTTLWLAFGVGAIVAWALTATNDLWGANQEPYRFWLDMNSILSITALPIAVLVAVSFLGARRGARTPAYFPTRPLGQRVVAGVVAGVTTVAALVTIAISSNDFIVFSSNDAFHTLINYNVPRENAIGDVLEANVDPVGPLVVTDPCVDVLGSKITSNGAPIATFNLGMAWPELKPEVEVVATERLENVFDAQHARDAGADWLVTDSACTVADWATEHADELEQVDTRAYTTAEGVSGFITLWRIAD